RAADLGQNAEALRLFERARSLHDQTETELAGGAPSSLTWTSDPNELRVATWQERTRLRLDIGDVLRRVGKLDDAEHRYTEARHRILRVERREQATIDPHETLRWEARVDIRLALVQRVRGDTANERTLVKRALALATEADASEDIPAIWAVLSGV